MNPFHLESSSFRDPSGFLFYYEGTLYRQINQSYKENYEHLTTSGLYDELANAKLFISHQSADDVLPYDKGKVYKIIKPEKIPFISYPYEWSFSQLKQAALATLDIQQIAMDFGMTLKDGSAYNIQFKDCKPILIDTLSFEMYQKSDIWKPYRQFCSHFLAPLALMAHKDVRLNQLLKNYIDGIPLDMTSAILPNKMFFSYSLLAHIYAHAKSQKHYGDKKIQATKRKLSKNQLIGLVASLHSGIQKLNWSPKGTEWADYYSDTSYSKKAFEQKKSVVSDWLDGTKPSIVWDLGANTGVFSRLASSKEFFTVSFDIDPAAVEQNFLNAQKNADKNILPLLLDLANPSPNLGWANSERQSFADRGPADVVMALALIHHLAISNNLPLSKIAAFFQTVSKLLIIEFIPKTDPQVGRLLATREDTFDDYDLESFEDAFGTFFDIRQKIQLNDSERTLYLMQNTVLST